jgi:hypothetical protein
MVAKTIGADLVQVEEYSEKEITANGVIEMAKKFAADTVKFDQGAFDDARRALATLIMVEAKELGEGHDERHSLACLLSATHALMEWYEGEAYEGEVAPMPEEVEEMEMAIEPEDVKADDEVVEADDEKAAMCKACGKAMGECECEKEKADDTVDKCLECGCHQPANDHGSPDVTTAVVIESDVKADTPEVSNIRAIVEDVVKSLLTNPTVGEEVATKAAESERIEALESELAQVKSLAAPSGPKRFAAVSNTTVDVNKSKAAIYRAKAANTLDKSLANGYLALAIDLEKSDS